VAWHQVCHIEAPVDKVDRMAYRTFLDSNGTEWHAWDVAPESVERRIADRRTSGEVLDFADRRRADRRHAEGCWSPLTSGIRDGWLCFDTSGDRRRLTPIPDDWEECGQHALEHYCRSATPARRHGSRRG
jgi:hypothetical protein